MSTPDQRVLIAGSGFIGLEVAAAAAQHGAQVTLLCRADRVMRRSVTETTARVFEHSHLRNGVDIRFNTELTEAQSLLDGQLALSDGSVLPVDELVVGIGVTPDTHIALEAGLECNEGIVVDSELRTADRRIRAIGDCATSRCYGEMRRVESVQNAVDQARYVARQIVADEIGNDSIGDFNAVPWFWTDQWGLKLQIAGIVDEKIDSVVTRGRTGKGSFSTFCYRSGALVAVESVNRPRDHLAARRILATKMQVSPELAADEDCDLKDLAKQLSIESSVLAG